MKLNKHTMQITNDEIGENLNHFVSLFCNTLLGSKSTTDKLVIYYTDFGRIEVTYFKGKHFEYVQYDSNGNRSDSCNAATVGWIIDKVCGYCYWQKCSVDRIDFIFW